MKLEVKVKKKGLLDFKKKKVIVELSNYNLKAFLKTSLESYIDQKVGFYLKNYEIDYKGFDWKIQDKNFLIDVIGLFLPIDKNLKKL